MNKRKIVSVLVLVVFLSVGLGYIIVHKEDFARFQFPSIWAIVELIVLELLLIICNGYLFRLVLIPFGIRLMAFEYIGLSFVTSMANYILPFVGGPGVRAIYIKKNYNLEITVFIGTVMVSLVLVLATNAIAGFFGVIFLKQLGQYRGALQVIFLGFLVGLFILLKYLPASINRKIFFRNYLNKFLSAWNVIKKTPAILVRMIVVSCIIMLISTAIYWRVMSIYIDGIGLLQALMIAVVTSFSVLISVTPASLGISETLTVLMAQLINFDAPGALAGALTYRVTLMLLTFLIGPVFAYFLSGRKLFSLTINKASK